MKVLFLARYLPAEGSTTQMYSLAQGLIAQGWQVDIVSGGPDGGPADALLEAAENAGVRHHRAGFPVRPSFDVLGKIVQLLTYVCATPTAILHIRRIRPDVIHVHYPVTSFIASLWRRLTGTPFVTTYHISGIPRHPLNRTANAAIAISSELRSEIEERFGYDSRDVHLVYNGVDPQRFRVPTPNEKAVARANLGLDSTEIVIAFVGSFDKRKGLDILLKALAAIKELGAHLLLVGDGDTEWLQSCIQNNTVEELVQIVPFRDPVGVYWASDIFVLPSRREGFPLVTVEAMMTGTPVIRSDVEGATEQISHGETGLLFPSEDADALASHLRQLINSPGQRQALAQAGARDARKRFPLDVMAKSTAQVYDIVRGRTQR